MNRDGFVIFRAWVESINALPEEYQLDCYKALANYGLTGVISDDITPVTKAMLISFSFGMEKSVARYSANVENGRLGGRPKKTQENPTKTQENPTVTQENPTVTQENPTKTQENPTVTQENLNENEYENEYENENIISKKVSKKEIIRKKNAYAYARESYDEIMERMHCSAELTKALGAFIQHCALNKYLITNDRLIRLIEALNRQGNDKDRIKWLNNAVDKNHIDVFNTGKSLAGQPGYSFARFENEREYSQEYFDSLLKPISKIKI